MKTRKDRHEKLMDARVRFNKQRHCNCAGCLEAVDYLFYEIDLLIHEVEELKRPVKRGEK